MHPPEARDIFMEAVELEGDARQQYIAQACAASLTLRRAVEALLLAHDQASGFLGDATMPTRLTFGAGAFGNVDEELAEGTMLGPYRIERALGEGGFGIVYRAEQVSPIQRTVAIKVVRPGMDSGAVVRRFEAERQTLAMMNHAAIARIFDAGATASGRPYFVMEFVEGEPISTFCDRRRLTLDERLALFERVCGAVAHAHQKGVIHRDLKPGNILVTDDDGAFSPRVIDFGIAKAVAGASPAVAAAGDITQPRQLLGTPLYMAPEQASGGEIDTRTDVYALGVVLYELLCGLPPFERNRLDAASIFSLMHIICQEDPPRPSARFMALGNMGDAIAQARDSDTLRLWRDLSGDIDHLVMKAIAKDPADRYATVDALAADVRRFLAGAPLDAGPPTLRYRLGKLIRRRKIETAAIALAVLALVGLAGAAVYVAIEQRAQATRLAEQTLRSDAAADFARSVLSSVDPARARGADTTLLREILDDAATRVITELADNPDAAIDMLTTLGVAHARLGDLPKALTLLRNAFDRATAHAGPIAAVTLEAGAHLAGALTESARYDEAIDLFAIVLDGHITTHGPDAGPTESAQLNLATALGRGGYPDRAAAVLARLHTQRKARLGPDHDDTQTAANNLAIMLSDMGDDAGAAELLAQVLEAQKRTIGVDHPRAMTTAHNLAAAYSDIDRLDDAITLLTTTITHKSAVFGDEHPSTLSSISALAGLLSRQGQHAEAEAMFRRALAASEASPNDPRRAGLLNGMAGALSRQDRHDEAEPFARQAAELMRSLAGPDHPHTLQVTANYVRLLLRLSRLDEARALAIDTHARALERLGPVHPIRVELCIALAIASAGLGEADQAATLLREAIEACNADGSTAAAAQRDRLAAALDDIENP
ncbi:MAG: tetratricopeptide repeat protein [Phycisphaeraceae bacterium]|nr:tetratricopeptide repeat protein [Phycisphaeraceae bacterium]MCW5764215.1 tetratricopeptide repeat protein [Phycisphaeraceae bacterium]